MRDQIHSLSFIPSQIDPSCKERLGIYTRQFRSLRHLSPFKHGNSLHGLNHNHHWEWYIV